VVISKLHEAETKIKTSEMIRPCNCFFAHANHHI